MILSASEIHYLYMTSPYKNSSQPELANCWLAVCTCTIRFKMGISQEDIADLAGIDRSYLGGIERGEHNLALINIKGSADALDCVIISECFYQKIS